MEVLSSGGAIGFEAFVEAVDRLVTPAMLELGYLRIGAYRSTKASRGSDEYAVGYEAHDEAARRQVMPDDPATADEAWLRLDPSKGELSFSPVFAQARSYRAADGQEPTALSGMPARLQVVGIALERLRQCLEGG